MISSVHRSSRRGGLRRGVSLLEVLISIGILAVGLTAALSLIPAGRTYMKKAAVDDRAAAMVPNAFATMLNLGLFRQQALTWVDLPPPNQPQPPQLDRENVWSLADLRTVTAWDVKTTETATIDEWYPSNPPPTQFSGTISPPPQPGTTVTVTSSTGGAPAAGGPGGSAAVAMNGGWVLGVPASGGFPAPDMEIETSGSNAGAVLNQPYADYTVTATYVESGEPTSANVTPSSFRQYGRLRKSETRTGRGLVEYRQTDQARNGDLNNFPDNCVKLQFPAMTNTTSQMRGAIARSSAISVNGTVWRCETGFRRGKYSRSFSYPNVHPSSGTPGTPTFDGPTPDPDRDAGDAWVDANLEPKDPSVAIDEHDWFEFSVQANEIIEIAWSAPNGGLQNSSPGGLFPAYFNNEPTALLPFEVSGNACKYATTGDGTFRICGTILDAYSQRLPARGSFVFPYSLMITRSRSERVIAIDPLMATRLDKVLSLRGQSGQSAGLNDLYAKRRDRFADFQQMYSGSNTSRSFVVPRLNWQRFASGELDTMLAMAERLFRDEDNLAINEPRREDDAPAPLYDRAANGSPARRQATGRTTWVLMVQPEARGSVASNWTPGAYFDVSLVIYEDRRLPSLDAAAALEGEHAFEGEWSDLSGLVSVTVPFDSDRDGAPDLVGDDVRGLFRAGAWVLLAPKTIYSLSPADDQQRLQWIKIRSSEFENTATGMRAELLLETEPGEDVLLRSRQREGTQAFPVIVCAHDGVVAVVNKSVRLSE
jgi:prepilin-type N-terminal cleavage/methylation domain-containing protein